MAIATLTSNETGANSLTDINANFVDLDTTKADLASPTFTGTPTLPTGTIATTQSAGDSSTKIATTAFVASASVPTIETTSGTTHSLTTTAGQKVVVWAKGDVESSNSGCTITLKYNGVAKDNVYTTAYQSSARAAFSLMYTETPGAATQNITVTTDGGALANVMIIVLKIG